MPPGPGTTRHLATAEARTERAAATTVARIRGIYTAHRGAYGAPRIHAELRELGVHINRKRVTRLIRGHKIVGRRLSGGRRTMMADRAAPAVPDLIGRKFTGDTPHTRWCGDIPYVPAGVVVPVSGHGDRHLFASGGGVVIAEHMRTELVTNALEMADLTRGARRGRGGLPQ